MEPENNYSWWRLAGDEWSNIWVTLCPVDTDNEIAYIYTCRHNAYTCQTCGCSLSERPYLKEIIYSNHHRDLERRYCMEHPPIEGIEFA